MNSPLLKKIHWPLILSVFILLVVLSFLSEGFYGAADNPSHYFISRYSFQHPALFLDTWGRPLFTIMSSPFSQFGFGGMKFFNVLLGCITAYLAYRIADKTEITPAWMAILFVIFTPMYFLMTMTGLTEIQFGFILILAIFLFFHEKYIAAAIIISFLPLSRSEGFAFLPLFFLAILMRRKYAALPFLVTGLLFFSIIGYLFVWKDFFWIFTHSPYPLHHPLYKEEGNLLHFVNATPEIFGIPLLVLFLAGTLLYGYLLFSVPKDRRLQIFLEVWLLVIPVWMMFALNSVLYWKALFGSVGLVRVVTGLLPLAAIVSLKAFSYLEKTVFRQPASRIVFRMAVIANFTINAYPVRLLSSEQTVKRSADWIMENSLKDRKIFFTNAYVPLFLELDPYNKKESEQLFGTKWLQYHPVGSLIVWDSYFGPREADIPLAVLENKYGFRLLNIIREHRYKKVVYGFPWEVYIFEKSPYGTQVDNKRIRDSIVSRELGYRSARFVAGDLFEDSLKKENRTHLTRDFSRSGSHSFRVNGSDQYECYHELELSTFSSQNEDVTFRVSCFVYPTVPFSENETRLVLSIKNRDDHYHSLGLDSTATRINEWNKITFLATFPADNPSDRVVVYFWHLGNKAYYVDDLKIEVVAP
jgi:hypothetical protein